MSDRTIRVRFRAEVADLKRSLSEAAAASDKTSASFDKNGQKIETSFGRATRSVEVHREAWTNVGAAITAVGAGGIATIALGTNAAMEWESAFAGVLKTVNGTALEIAQLEDDLRAMALVKPADQSTIAAVAAAAGQLGVKAADVAEFTGVMIDLGESTNLSAEEAATSLARVANIMGTATSDVDRMGNVVVRLGNSSATTEAEIVALVTRLAAAGKQAGLTEADLFAIASTMSSVGIEAEAGGTAMSKVFTSIADAVRDGGEDLQTFAGVAGMSVESFKNLFERDAAGAVSAFVEGMGRMSASGESTTAVFEDLELTDERLKRSVLSVGSATGLLGEQLAMANQEWANGNALAAEAATRYETTESKIALAKNAIRDAGIELGENFLPIVGVAASAVSDAAQAFSGWPEPLKDAASYALAGASSVGVLAGSVLLLTPRVYDTVVGFKQLNEWTSKLPPKLQAVGKAGGVAGAALAGLATAGLVKGFLEEVTDASRELPTVVNELLGLRDAGDITSTALGRAEQSMAGLAVIADEINGKPWYAFGASIEDWFGDRIGDTAYRQQIALQDYAAGIANIASSGDFETAAAKFNLIAEYFGAASDADYQQVLDLMPEYRDALLEAANAADRSLSATELLAVARGDLAIATEDGTLASEESLKIAADLAAVQEQVAAATEAAAEAGEKYAEALDEWRSNTFGAFLSFIDNPGAYQAAIDAQIEWAQSVADSTESAEDSWENYYDGVSVSAGNYIDQLTAQVDRQKQWAEDVLVAQERINAIRDEAKRAEAQAQFDSIVQQGSSSPAAALVSGLADWESADFATIVDLWAQSGTDAGTEFTNTFQSAANPHADLLLDLTQAQAQLDQWIAEQTVILDAQLALEANPYTEWFSNDPRNNIPAITAPQAGLGPVYPGYKDGGPIVGPGSGTSDSILIRASHGEEMWSAREVAGAGGHGVVSTLRSYAREGNLAGALQYLNSGPEVVQIPVKHETHHNAPVSIYTSASTLTDAEDEKRRRFAEMRGGK